VFFRPAAAVLAAVLATSGGVLAGAPAASAGVRQGSVVSEAPKAGTPQILNGAVLAVTQVGDTMVAGGSFTQVDTANPSATPWIIAFDAGTGAVRTKFRPNLDGKVQALLPGPVQGTVYVGGEFNNANGRPAKSLVLLDLSDGSFVRSFQTPSINGTVQTLGRVGQRLYVGGTFTKLGGGAHGGLVTLDASTGAVDPYLNSDVSVNHNWTPASDPDAAKGAVGVFNLDITPDGNTMVAIGNFKRVDGTVHDQIAMWNLKGGDRATLRDWKTTRLEPECLAKVFDSYVRDVDFSPDGRYFVLAATGGDRAGTLCDSASRWETGASGQNVQPSWVASTGGDSLLSTAVTGEAVYVGGHQRWLNNDLGNNRAGPGAVPRPGVAALDPANGVPMSWNPGRNPRGEGTYVLYATGKGLWMGSDTGVIGVGPTKTVRQRIAFFPLAGGRPAASKQLQGLPGGVYLGDGGSFTVRRLDGSGVGPVTRRSTPLNVPAVRGTTQIGSTLFYGKADGDLYRRTLNGGTWGPEKRVDPYNDPAWSDVQTGSGQTYRGRKPAFYAEIPNLTSMFYDGTGRLFYTLAGSSALYSRAFSPDSGVVHPVRAQVAGVSLPDITGAFLSEGKLFYVTRANGNLNRVDFNGRPQGGATVVSGPAKNGVDWRGRVLFLGDLPAA